MMSRDRISDSVGFPIKLLETATKEINAIFRGTICLLKALPCSTLKRKPFFNNSKEKAQDM